jgi:hypothetical protein
MQYLFVGLMVLLLSGVGGGVSSEKTKEYRIADETVVFKPLNGWRALEAYVPNKVVKFEFSPTDGKHAKFMLDMYSINEAKKPMNTPEIIKEMLVKSMEPAAPQSVEKAVNVRKLPEGACGFGFAAEMTDASLVGKKNTNPEEYLVMTRYSVLASKGFIFATLFYDNKNDPMVKDFDTYMTSGICAKKDAGAPVKGK